jgi:gas vesicle protein
MSGNRFVTNLSYFAVGIGLGAVVAILFAPKSGKETRRLIVNRTGEGRDYVAARGKELRRQAEEAVDKGKDYVTRQKERFAEALKAS